MVISTKTESPTLDKTAAGLVNTIGLAARRVNGKTLE